MKALKREPNIILENHALIGLTKRAITLVSLQDFEILSQYKWALHISAQRRVVRYSGRDTIYLHRQVIQLMGLTNEYMKIGNEIDHINGDTLDNRRDNLRVTTHTENMRNTSRHKNRVGVMFHKGSGNWFSYLNYPGNVVVSLGYWKTKEKAEEVVEQAKALQNTCETKAIFLEEWNKVKPRKNWVREGM